jgi:hypothetical protein
MFNQGGSMPKVVNWRFPVAVQDITANSNYKRKFPWEGAKILVTNQGVLTQRVQHTGLIVSITALATPLPPK